MTISKMHPNCHAVISQI